MSTIELGCQRSPTCAYPLPKSWDEFQDITLTALKLRWRSPNLQQNGRQGQSQAGVDILGEDDLGRLVGVQCKSTGDELTVGLVNDEVEKAERFLPRLATFFIATAGAPDAKIQKAVRLLSAERVGEGKFPVSVLFWDDLLDDLATDAAQFAKHFPQLGLTQPAILVEPPLPPLEQRIRPLGSDELWLPNLGVWEKNTDPKFPERLAHVRFYGRVHAPALAQPSFEPNEERSFLRLVKEVFWEDINAELEPPTHAQITVQNKPADLRYHRRWARWSAGIIGCASTLRGETQASYAVADMTADLYRLFQLVGRLDQSGPCVVIVEVSPGGLPSWKLADRRVRVNLSGIEEAGLPFKEFNQSQTRWLYEGSLEELRQPEQVVGHVVVRAARRMHGSRINSQQFIVSIPTVLDDYRECGSR